jgi:hypothetical protein
MSNNDSRTINILTESFKRIYTGCVDSSNHLIKNQSIEDFETITLLQNLKSAREYANSNDVKLPHVDLAMHPAQLNTCFSKYKTFMSHNLIFQDCPTAQIEYMKDFLTGLDGQEII